MGGGLVEIYLLVIGFNRFALLNQDVTYLAVFSIPGNKTLF